MRASFTLPVVAMMLISGLPARAADPPPIFVDQGPNAASRDDFYSRDQGSRMIPLSWLKAFKQANGQPFLADSLARYGYLPNSANGNGLPVGFTETGAAGLQVVGTERRLGGRFPPQ